MLNEQQEYILNEAVKWWKFGSNQIFQYTGEAGTGKTFLLFEIIKAIGLSFDSIAFMAYTRISRFRQSITYVKRRRKYY